jgi:hypothetical protein
MPRKKNEVIKRAIQNTYQLIGYFQAITDDLEICQNGVEMLLEIRDVLEKEMG